MEILREEWRPCVGHDGYEVSNLGNVRSVDRIVICRGDRPRRRWKGKLLVQAPIRGYLVIKPGGNSQVRYVHLLVARAFLGERPKGLTVNHKDGVKTNNSASNLEYVTYKENTQHAFRIGLRHCGEKNPRAKITEAQAREGYRLVANGLSQSAAGRIIGIPAATLSSIVRGKSWKHLKLQPIGEPCDVH